MLKAYVKDKLVVRLFVKAHSFDYMLESPSLAPRRNSLKWAISM